MTLWNDARLLIDGELVEATGGRTFDNINPATEEVIGPVPDASIEDAERAIAAARRAFDETDWARDHALRSRCLRQLRDGLQARLEEILQVNLSDDVLAYTMEPDLSWSKVPTVAGVNAQERFQELALERSRGGG